MPLGNIKSVKYDVDLFQIELDKETEVQLGLYYIERWVNVKITLNNIRAMTLVFPFNNKKFEYFYKKGGKDRFYFGDEYSGKFCVIYFEGKGSFTFTENKDKNNIFEVDKYFLDEGYKKFHLSRDLIHLRTKMKTAYGLEYNYEGDEPLLIFGLYNLEDIDLLKKGGKIGILWGGSDIMLDKKNRNKAIEMAKMYDCCNYAMSSKIYNKLLELGIINVKKVTVSFCWNDSRYRLRDFLYQRKKGIYIYDGMDKSGKKKIIYNQELVDKIVDVIGKEYKIYRSSDGYVEDILSLYKDCFASIRLTEYDGNANSAQECGMLGLPVISNQSMNHCLTWKSGEEVIYKCRYIFERNIRIPWIKKGVNILLISNDMPGKGGGATFTGNLKEYLQERGFNIWEIYLLHHEKQSQEQIGKRYIVKYNQKKRWDFYSWMEKTAKSDNNFNRFLKDGCKVILRSALTDIKRLKERFEVIFMSPGIYKNEMGKDFDVKYVNASNLKTANMVDTYANSSLTQSIFQKFGLNEVKLLEINLLQLRERYENSERDIDFLFVVSNIERKIKNTKLFLELARKIDKKFMLISADKIKLPLPKIQIVINPDDLNIYYRRAKCLINCSYFDSMSNVVLEAINNGCHVLVSENNGVAEYVPKEMRDKFIVTGYEIRDWEEKMRWLIDNWDNFAEERKKLWHSLRKKSWEVEVKLLELLVPKT